jgi:hypothetical protein
MCISDPLPALGATFNFPFPPAGLSCYSLLVLASFSAQGAATMEWTTPQHEEIDLNCEISSYANAEL